MPYAIYILFAEFLTIPCTKRTRLNHIKLLRHINLLHKKVTNMEKSVLQSGYRVEKQNLQVVKLVDSEHVNENMVQNSSPTCKHNLFALIKSKKMFLKHLALWKSLKRLRESELSCAHLE